MRSHFVVVAVVILSLALSAEPVAATEGEMTITSDTTLTEDHQGNIVVAADGVTLDCDGHTVVTDEEQDDVGVLVDNRTGVTVRDCSVFVRWTGWAFGVTNSSGVRLEGNTAGGDGASDGFIVEYSDHITLENNLAEGSTGAGFSLFGTADSTVVGNTSVFNGNGFSFILTGENAVTGNLAEHNTGSGFVSFENAGVFTANAAHANGETGFFSEYGNEVYVDNTCVGNGIGSDPPGLCDESGTFADDDGNTFELDIEWMNREGITKGCNPPTNDLYCPGDPVTRGQMAAFLVRAMGYTDSSGDLFTDDDGSTFEADINKLATAGVTKGCNPPANTEYCPDDFVTRGQMAAFLVRAMNYTDEGGGDLFTDDDGSTFEDDIDKLGTAGVTKGCNPPTNDMFCPDELVSRGQMAAFLHRALDA